MQVSVKAIPMGQIPDDMNQLKKRIDSCLQELAQVRRELSELSGLEEPIQMLGRCEERMEMQKRYCTLFANTISQIYRQYVNTENRIIDSSENASRKAQRESLVSRNLTDLYPLFYKVLSTKGGDYIGD